MPRLTALLFLLAVPACASATGDDLATSETPQTLFVSPPDTEITVGAELDHDGVTDKGVAELAVTDGTIDVAFVDRDPVLLELTLALDDIRLPDTIYPGNIVLTDVAVTMTPPSTELVLTWNAIIEGAVHPLAPQTLPPFHVALSLGDDGHSVDAALTHDGEVWTYLGVVRLSDAALFVHASDEPVVP